MKYSKAKDIIKSYDKILVSGPERSGTTIASEIIAKDLGLRPIREEYFGCTNFDSLIMILLSHDDFVLQCPEIAFMLHYLQVAEQKTKFLTIFMMRDIEDIVDSQERLVYPRWASELNWTQKCEANLIGRYKHVINQDDKVKFEIDPTEKISELKYRFWEEVQKEALADTLELEYESLKGHPLWVDKEKRLEFGSRQTEDMDPLGMTKREGA